MRRVKSGQVVLHLYMYQCVKKYVIKNKIGGQFSKKKNRGKKTKRAKENKNRTTWVREKTIKQQDISKVLSI